MAAPAAHPNQALRDDIGRWAYEYGFQQTGVAGIDLADQEPRVRRWLRKGFHGEMGYMARNLYKRLHPPALAPETCSVICVRMNYFPGGDAQGGARELQADAPWKSASWMPLRTAQEGPRESQADAPPGRGRGRRLEDVGKDARELSPSAEVALLAQPQRAYISRYALGRDYHKVVRARLVKLANRIDAAARGVHWRFRAFTDSAPVLEKALGRQAGLGWVGKHSLLLHPQDGSWFFLGEIYTNLPLPETPVREPDRCGACRACINRCPTGAIVADGVVDARRCISYLTIEHKGAIPERLRPLMGNRIFGCDDCQLYCPWNRAAPAAEEADFRPRHGLEGAELLQLFLWDEQTFLRKTEGMALRRLDHERWRRNLAVALGNGPSSPAVVQALRAVREGASEMLREHIDWALRQLEQRTGARPPGG